MKIETKYSNGDLVWYIGTDACERLMACKTCEDKKEIEIKGEFFRCPSCVTDRRNNRWAYRSYVRGSSIIGKVIFSHEYKYHDPDVIEIQYMLEDTGIGSGTLWYENKLFSTKEEAQAWCDKFNSEQV